MSGRIELATYKMTPQRGYLPTWNPQDIVAPAVLHPIRDAALDLPHTISAGGLRGRIDALPRIDMDAFIRDATPEQLRIAMVHYSFLAQAYVWGEEEAPRSLPASIAAPMWRLGAAVGQPPLLTYANYVLDNWALIDPDGPIDLSNLYMIQPFLAGQDEAWFVVVHVAIEARAGRMLGAIPDAIAAVEARDDAALAEALREIAAGWNAVNAIFDRMPERCDPYIYFQRVRPWIHGWKDNPALGDGLIYEGVDETNGAPQAFRGQTGSQSSIVPAMDACFGVGHADDPLRAYLDELHAYRPPEHRAFIDDVRAQSRLRDHLLSESSAQLRTLYNDCIEGLTRFRTRHLEYAASYIHKQARTAAGNDTDVGTGGTPFMKYLKKHRDEADAHLL